MTAPSDVTATDDQCEQVSVIWTDNSFGESGFRIYRDGSLAHTTAPNVTRWDDIPAPGSYVYEIWAVNLDCGVFASGGSDPGTRLEGAAAPSNVTASENLCDRISVTWTDNSNDEDGFRIYRDGSLAHTTEPNVTGWDDLPAPGTHAYEIRAFNSCGESVGDSDPGTLPSPEIRLSTASLTMDLPQDGSATSPLSIANDNASCELDYVIEEHDTPSTSTESEQTDGRVSGSTRRGPIRGIASALAGEPVEEAIQDLGWLAVDPDSGSVAPGGSVEITVTFNSTGLDSGRYDGYLWVRSNTVGADSIVVVHCELNVQGPSDITGGAGGGGSLPRSYSLLQNYPNPFNPSTTIEYTIPEGAGEIDVTIGIYDLRGKRVRTLVDARMGPGRYSAYWNGQDHLGAPVGSGIYLYRITAGNFTSMKKLIVMK